MTTENNGAAGAATPEATAAAAAAAELAAKGATGTEGAPASKAPAGEPSALPVAEGEPGAKGEITYNPTGDTGLDMALAFVGKNGFGPDHPAMIAAINGDFGLLRAQLAEKNVPGSEAYLALAEKAYKSFDEKHKAQRESDKAAVLKVVGGEESWSAIQEWAKANADESESAALNDLLGKGGQHAVIAAGFLAAQYERANGGAGGAETDGAGPSAAAARGAPAVSEDALSPKDYGAAVMEARQKHNAREGRFEDSAAYSKLLQRRARFKG